MVAVLQRLLEASLVRDEDHQRDVVRNVDEMENLDRVVELRYDVRAHEARHLDAPQPGPRERIDQPNLVGCRDPLRLVLKAVAGADLANLDLHVTSARSSSFCTRAGNAASPTRANMNLS